MMGVMFYFFSFIFEVSPRSFGCVLLEPVSGPVEIEDITQEDDPDLRWLTCVPFQILQHSPKDLGRKIMFPCRFIDKMEITDEQEHCNPLSWSECDSIISL